MSNSNRNATEAARTTIYYHGTRADLTSGHCVEPGEPGKRVYLTPNLDAAIWDAELASGEGVPRVYVVEPLGKVEPDADLRSPGHPTMAHVCVGPLRIVAEVTQWLLYHGTRAALRPGDLIEPGRRPNFGNRERTTNYVYLTRTLDAATWGAELADGDGPGRIYVVEPMGPVEDDPNLTNQRFRGNPTKSFRSPAPLRVTREVAQWTGHPPDVVKAMRDGLAKLERRGVEPMDD